MIRLVIKKEIGCPRYPDMLRSRMEKFLICIFSLLLLFGCGPGAFDAEGDISGEPITIPQFGEVTLQFRFDSTQQGLPQGGQFYLVYQDTESRKTKITTTPISEGQNSVILPKGRVNSAYIVHTDAPLSRVNSRSIGSSISTIGNIGIISAGLDSLPVSKESAAEVDLGGLSFNETEKIFNAPVSSGEISVDLGVPESDLLPYGNYDEVLSKHANLDIDQNGMLDGEDGLFWDLKTLYYFILQPGKVDFHNQEMLVSSDSIRPAEFFYSFDFYNFFDRYTDANDISWDSLSLQLPSNADGLTELPSNGGMGTFLNGNNISWRTFPVLNAENRNMPYNGTYQLLSAGSPFFEISDVSFIRPETNYEDFLVPILDLDVDSSGEIQNFELSWQKVFNEAFVDATPGEIEWKVKSVSIALPNFTTNEMIMLYQNRDYSHGQWLMYEGNAVPFSYYMQLNDGEITNQSSTIDLGTDYFQQTTFSMAPYNLLLQDNKFITVMYEDVGGNLYFFDYFNTNYLIEDYSLPSLTSSSWENGPAISEEVSNATFTAIEGRLYLLYKDNISGESFLRTSNLQADGTPEAWSASATLPFNLARPDCTVWDGSLYVSSLSDGTAIYRGVVDAATGAVSWTADTFLPAAVTYHALAAGNGYLYLADSFNNKTIWSAAIDPIDGSLGTWVSAADLSSYFPLSEISDIVCTNDFLILAAGLSAAGHGLVSSVVLTAELNGATLDNLRYTSNLPVERLVGTRIETWNNHILFLGGGGVSIGDATYIYDLFGCAALDTAGNLGSWKLLDSFTGPRILPPVAVWDDMVYLTGGSSTQYTRLSP